MSGEPTRWRAERLVCWMSGILVFRALNTGIDGQSGSLCVLGIGRVGFGHLHVEPLGVSGLYVLVRGGTWRVGLGSFGQLSGWFTSDMHTSGRGPMVMRT